MYIESEILELKERYTESVVRDIVSFLNTGGGKIMIGVKDDGEVIGIPVNELDQTQAKLSDCITSQIEPSPQSEIRRELIQEEGKNVVVVNVGERDKAPLRH